MTLVYPKYAMKDGRTRWSQDYFNPIWKSLDERIDALEKQKMDFETAIRAIQEFGLERIDSALVPVLEEAQASLTASQAILAELQTMIGEADIPALIAAAMAPFIAEVEASLEEQNTATTESINTLQEDLDAVRTLAYAGL